MNQSLASSMQAGSDSDASEKDQKGSLTGGLTGTFRSELQNPVLPLEFDLFTPFANAWEGFKSCRGGLK